MLTWLTWALALISTGLIGIIGTQWKAKKRKTRVWTFWIGIPLIVLGIVSLIGIWPLLDGLAKPIPFGISTGLSVGGGVGGDIGGPNLGKACTPQFLALGFVDVGGKCACLNTDGDVTVTLSATDAITSQPAGTTHRYRVGGKPASTVSNANTFTGSPGDIINILWGNETDSNYYGAVTQEIIPCKGTETFTAELYQNGTITIEVFNEEGNLIDNAGENETLGSGDIVNLPINLKGTFERGIPYGGVLVLEFNDTAYDEVAVDFGLGEVKADIPGVYSVQYTAADVMAYEVPPILSNQKLTGNLRIDVANVDPGQEAGGNINMTFYPKDYFINEEKGGIFDGPAVEDEDDTQTFGHITKLEVKVD